MLNCNFFFFIVFVAVFTVKYIFYIDVFASETPERINLSDSEINEDFRLEKFL